MIPDYNVSIKKLIDRCNQLRGRVITNSQALEHYLDKHEYLSWSGVENSQPSLRDEYIQIDLLIKLVDKDSPLLVNLGRISNHYIYTGKDVEELKDKYLYVIDQLIDHLEAIA